MPDYPVTDSKGRSMIMTGPRPPTPAEIERAAAVQFLESEPTFGSRVSEGLSGFVQGAKGLASMVAQAGSPENVIPVAVSRIAGMLNPENAKKMMDMPNHPLKNIIEMNTGADVNNIWNDVRDQRVGAALGDLVVPAAMMFGPKGVSKAVNAAGAAAESTGRGLFKQVAKISPSVAETTASARAPGGTILKGKNEIADTILQQGLGAPTSANQSQLTSILDAAGKVPGQRVAAAAAQGATIPKYALVNWLKDQIDEAKFALADPSAFKQWKRDLKALPPDVPVDRAHAIVSGPYGIYQRNAPKFSATTKPMSALADIGLAHETVDELKQAVPGLAEANARYARLKPAAEAYNQMTGRITNTSHRLPDTLTAIAGLGTALAGHPEAGALGAALGIVASHPTPQGWMAQQLYRGGRAIPGSVNPSALYRALVLSKLAGQAQGEQ